MKAHQNNALLAHMAYGQTSAVAITPAGSIHGPQHLLGPDIAQVPQVVFQHALLDGHLRIRMQVLHFAATTGPDM